VDALLSLIAAATTDKAPRALLQKLSNDVCIVVVVVVIIVISVVVVVVMLCRPSLKICVRMRTAKRYHYRNHCC
jgi:hypothetical protein